MTMKEIVNKLEKNGNKIKYRQRKDGGIIITSINGQKMGITEGNRLARSMVGKGGKLSKKREKQLSYNVKRYIKLKPGQHKARGKPDADIVKLVRKVQRTGRKTKVDTGRVTMRKVRYHLKTEGREKTIEYLQRRMRYFQGYANENNINAIQERINRIGYGIQSNLLKSKLQSISRILEFKSTNIKEEDVKKIIEILYNKETTLAKKISMIESLLSYKYGN